MFFQKKYFKTNVCTWAKAWLEEKYHLFAQIFHNGTNGCFNLYIPLYDAQERASLNFKLQQTKHTLSIFLENNTNR